MTVVLTRPAHRNAALATRLERCGATVLCLPALQLVSLDDGVQHVPEPDAYDLIVFVSSHAAQSYLDRFRSLRSDLKWPKDVTVATVGQASAQPLLQADFIPEHQVMYPALGAHGQDSEGLWHILEPVLPRVKKVLIVRGQAGREWLGARFEQMGAVVTRLSLYRREPVIWSATDGQALTQALTAQHPAVFLLTSSESVDAVHANMQRLGLMSHWARSLFVVIHERIAAHLQSILQAADLHTRYPVKICAPSDSAIDQTIRLAVCHYGRL